MTTFCLQFVVPLLLSSYATGETGIRFEKEQCNFTCQVFDYKVLSGDAVSKLKCAYLSLRRCHKFLYRQDTGMCICFYTNLSPSKNLALLNEMMTFISDEAIPAQCYAQKSGSCDDVGYSWIPEFQTCVRVVTTQQNFQTAIAKCSAEGAHLVMPSTPIRMLALNKFLFLNGYLSEYWIGVDDILVEGKYMWTNGLPVLCTTWWPNIEPSATYNQNCVRLAYKENQQFYWRDHHCGKTHGFICAKDTY